MSNAGERKLRLGVAGLGRAFTLMLPTLQGDPRVALVAAADTRAEARRRFAADFSARGYETVEDLCADPAVEAVYVATPHQYHAHHAALAARQQLTLESVERDHIVTVLRQTDGVVDGPRGAARILELHPNTLRNRMKKLGITRASHQIL